MNFEEKYNEILEWARKNKARLNGVPIEEVLPELAESEDERIRKRLIEYFEGFRIGNAKVKWEGLTVQDVLAWLEKQKEQKPWKVGANAYFTPEQKPADLSEMMVHKEPYIAPVPTPMVADEQKPVKPSGKLSRQDYLYQLLIDQLITYSDYEYLIGQKPTEWKATLNGEPIPTENQSVEIPLAEWSDEDEKYLNRVINLWVNDFGEDSDTVKWLKSLRPSWKPSEEQMEALLNTLHPDNPYYHDLKSLYEQLKKL